jgi:iron complex transport system ATP-binding protein
MIRVRGLGFSYGDRPVLSDVELDVGNGEILGVLGPNGSGKSTLLGLLRGVLRPGKGTVQLMGESPWDMSRRNLARLLAVVPQTLVAEFAFTVEEIVAMGRYAQGPPAGVDEEAVRVAMVRADVAHLRRRAVTEVSGGELQRVALARALAQETPLLLLDEVTSHLDVDHTLEVMELVLNLNRENGLTVVQVSHDADLAAATSHTLLLLSREGRPVAVGTPDEVLTRENLQAVYRADLVVENNPRTGTPRIVPLLGARVSRPAR